MLIYVQNWLRELSVGGLVIDLNNIKPNTVIVIAGPTASGKSALALDLAGSYNGVVINADASQIYKTIPIISAAPSKEDKQQVEHLLYEIFEPEKNGSVSEWLNLAVKAIKDSWKKGKLPIVVGGTGFYIESLIKGVSPIPETKVSVKEKVRIMLEKGGVSEIYEALKKCDEGGASRVNPNDVTRVRRALEIFLDTGKSINEWFDEPLINYLPEADFNTIVLLPQLSKLEDKCSLRFDWMIQNGALLEVEALKERGLDKNLPVMKAIGVPELIAYLNGEYSLEEAIKQAKLHTRQYAKRQLTWFRNRLKNIAHLVIE